MLLSGLCSKPLDLLVVIDKSDYWTGQFTQLKEGVNRFVDSVFVGENTTHVAVVSYSREATLHFNLVRYFRTGRGQPTWNVINGIVQDDSGTDTARVSLLTFLDIFSTAGDRRIRKETVKTRLQPVITIIQTFLKMFTLSSKSVIG